MQMFDFPEMLFSNFWKNSKNCFHASLLGFSKRFISLDYVWKTPTNKKFQPKWVLTVLGRNNFGC